MSKMGFVPWQSEQCIFRTDSVWIILYVDDIIMLGRADEELIAVVCELKNHLDVKDLGRLHHFLGVSLPRRDGVGFLSQERYVERILEHYGMKDCKPVQTPMPPTDKTVDVSAPCDNIRYPEMVGSLSYLCTRTRPDICAGVYIVAISVPTISEINMFAVKNILRYLRGTSRWSLRSFGESL